MASITIRDVDIGLEHRLRQRAAAHGRSVEDEVLDILRRSVVPPQPPRNLARSIRSRVAPFGGVELDIPDRTLMGDPPSLR